MKRLLHWAGERFKDVFYDTDNEHLDGARLAAYTAIFAEIAAAGYDMLLKSPIDLGPNGLGGGLSAILVAGAGFLAAKEWSKKKYRESAAIAQNTAVAAEKGTVVTSE